MSQRPTRLLKILGKNIRLRRMALGLSQEELANISGLHRTYVGAVERSERNVTVATLETLASALQTTVVDLLSDG